MAPHIRAANTLLEVDQIGDIPSEVLAKEVEPLLPFSSSKEACQYHH